jgi:two-component system nitrogen regulation response regulator GlnG
LQQSAKQLGVEPKRIADAALAQLAQFEFPGNVRQLENICHWLTVMAPAQVIEVKDLPPEVLASRLARESAPASAGSSEPIVIPSAHAPLPDIDRPAPPPAAATGGSAWSALAAVGSAWETGLEAEALSLLAAGNTDVWDVLSKRFESKLIQTALTNTRGRRIEAAMKLGIGRNTITRKIQELGLE